MQANSWQIISLLFDLLNLESVEKKGKKYTKINILRTKKAFLMK